MRPGTYRLTTCSNTMSTAGFTIRCVARRMAGGQGHEHISYLWWVKVVDDKDTSEHGYLTREQMVAYVEKNGPDIVWCPDRNPALLENRTLSEPLLMSGKVHLRLTGSAANGR